MGINFEIWEALCWGGGGVIHFEIWELLFRDMGGAELSCGRQSELLCRIGSLVVNVPASGSSKPGLSLTRYSIFRSRNVNHETF